MERKKERGQARRMIERNRDITRRRGVSWRSGKESSSLLRQEENVEKGGHCYRDSVDSSTDKPHILEEVREEEEVQSGHAVVK